MSSPPGEGEHLLIELEKTGIGTPELARMLADAHGIDHVDVGYAGMKDKQAVTSQWFSLRGVAELDETVEAIDGVRVLKQIRHRQKLRRGELAGNDFRIRLRAVDPVTRLSRPPRPSLGRRGGAELLRRAALRQGQPGESNGLARRAPAPADFPFQAGPVSFRVAQLPVQHGPRPSGGGRELADSDDR